MKPLHALHLPSIVLVLVLALAAAGRPAAAAAADGVPDSAVTAAELLPLEEASWPMKVTAGPGSGASVRLTLEPEEGGRWRMALEGRNALTISELNGGRVVSEVVLEEESQRLVFEPPAYLTPATMTPGQSFQRSGKVRIFDIATGEQTTSGRYEQKLPPPSRTTYELPGGSLEAFEVSNSVTIETDWATVKLDLALGLSQEHGPVYRRLVSDVAKAAFFGSKTTRVVEQDLDAQ